MIRRSLGFVVFAGLTCSAAQAQHGGGHAAGGLTAGMGSAILTPAGGRTGTATVGGFGGFGLVGSYNPMLGYGYGTGFYNPTMMGYGNGFGYGYGGGFGANFNNPMNMGNGFGANFNNPMNAGNNNPQGAMNALIPTNVVPPGFNNENPPAPKTSTTRAAKGQNAKTAKAKPKATTSKKR
jgi:hypothetical protein